MITNDRMEFNDAALKVTKSTSRIGVCVEALEEAVECGDE